MIQIPGKKFTVAFAKIKCVLPLPLLELCGVYFLLVVLLGAAKGVENNFNRLFGNFATNSVFVWAQATSKPFKGFQEGRSLTLKMSDLENIRSEIKGLEFVVPRHQGQALAVNNFKTGNFGVFGDYPELDKVQKKDLVYGRFINDNDILEKKKVCVIEEEIYKQLFDKDEYPIGVYIKLNDINYKVVGMYKQGQIGSGGPQGNIHIPFTTFQQVYNRGDSIGWFMITGKPEFDIVQIEADVKLLLRNLHKVHPEDERAFGSFNLGEAFGKFMGFLIGMQFLNLVCGYCYFNSWCICHREHPINYSERAYQRNWYKKSIGRQTMGN